MQGNISHIKLYNLVMSHIENKTSRPKEINVRNYSIDDFEPVLIHELLTNIRLVIENEKLNNLQSMGVDICCRILIEISALLKASREGKLTDTQKRLFLLNYLAGDLHKQTQKENQPKEVAELFNRGYEEIIKEYQRLLNLGYKDAERVSKRYYNFLEYGGTKSYSKFTGFIAFILGSEYASYRVKIDCFIHPSYTGTKIVLYNENLEKEREKIINKVLTLASEYVPDFKSDEYVKSKWNNEYIAEEYLNVIKDIKKIFKEVFKYYPNDERWNETDLKDVHDRWIIYSCFRKLEATLVDAFVCESLELRTKSVTRCKAFVEMTSMIGMIMKSNSVHVTIEEFLRTSALMLRTKEQDSFKMFKKVDDGKTLKPDEQELYNKFITDTNEWYGEFKQNHDYPDNESEFAIKIRKSCLYFLNPDEHYNYPDLVKEAMRYYLGDGSKKNTQLYNDYLWSVKIGHACAYQNFYRENRSFNLIPNMIEYLIEVFDKTFYGIDNVGGFNVVLTSIADSIREQNRTNHEQMLSSTYKSK